MIDTTAVRQYLLGLQQHIVATMQAEDGKTFVSDGWTRPAGGRLEGDGLSRLIDLGDGVACFHFMHASFLLQDFCAEGQAESFMMHLLVDDVQAWWEHVKASGVEAGHGVFAFGGAQLVLRQGDF